MNTRNYQFNQPISNFNTSGLMRNEPSEPDNFVGRSRSPLLRWDTINNPQEQSSRNDQNDFGRSSMFSRDRFDWEQPVRQNNFNEDRHPQFSQHQLNQSSMNESQPPRMLDREPESFRGQFTESFGRGPGPSHDQYNRNQERESDWERPNRQNDFTVDRQPQFSQHQLNQSSMHESQQPRMLEREPESFRGQFTESSGRGPGPSRDQYNRNQERESDWERPIRQNDFTVDRQPQFSQHQLNQSSMHESQQPRMLEREPESFRGQFTESSGRGPGVSHDQYNRNQERESNFYQEHGNRSRDRSPPFTRRRHSQSPDQEISRMSPFNSRVQISPRRDGNRNSPIGFHGVNAQAGTTESRRQRAKRRKQDQYFPPRGEPGGLDDPNRLGLCGSRTKWYLRYLKQGIHPDEAIRMAREPKQPAQPSNNPPRPAVSERPSFRGSTGRNNVFEKHRSQGPSEQQSNVDEDKFSVFMVPVGYPRKMFSHREKLDVEEAIINEVAKAPALGAPIRFTAVKFKQGHVEVECANAVTAGWLSEVGSRLSTHNGLAIETRIQSSEIPFAKRYYMSLFLQRGAEKSDEFLLGLLKSQNNYNTDSWKLVSRKDNSQGSVVVISMNKPNALEIANNDFSMFYRYGQLKVGGLRRSLGLMVDAPTNPKKAQKALRAIAKLANSKHTENDLKDAQINEPNGKNGSADVKPAITDLHNEQFGARDDLPNSPFDTIDLASSDGEGG